MVNGLQTVARSERSRDIPRKELSMKGYRVKRSFFIVSALTAAGVTGIFSYPASASNAVQGVVNISSVRESQDIIHTCVDKDYEFCTLTIGVAGRYTTIRSEGKVIIGSAGQYLNVEADFIQVGSVSLNTTLIGDNGVWVQSDLQPWSRVEAELGNITVEGDVYMSFLTALQGRITVNGDLRDAARTGELGLTAQEVTIIGDLDPRYATVLELGN